jgi:antitoxin component of MazEF toxin-antitoxin module
MATVATVQMWGNARALRIPKGIAQENGLEPGTKVTITSSKDGAVVIRAVAKRPRYRLADLLAQCKGRNPHREAVTGRAGREVF